MWPWDWIIGAGNAVAGVSQAVYDWVVKLITGVLSWVSDAISSLWTTLVTLGSEIRQIWDNTVSFAENLIQSFTAWVTRTVQQIVGWVKGLIDDLWRFVDGMYNWVLTQLARIGNAISNAIQDVIGWVNREIWQPLVRFYNDLKNFVDYWIPRIWQYFQHPELIAEIVFGALLRLWTRYVERYGAVIARWILRQMMGMAGTVFDLLEHIISSII